MKYHKLNAWVKGKAVNMKYFLGLALVGLLAGCQTGPEGMYAYRDNASGDMYQLISDNQIKDAANPGTKVWINASRITQANGVILYYLDVHYESIGAWLNIEPGETLILTLDGQEHKYLGIGSAETRKKKGDRLVEDAIYKASAAELRAIAKAKSATVKIAGANGTLNRTFAPENIENFRVFVKQYIDGDQR